ncbi:DotI/IcmL protein [Acetobacter estunensis NRIC 0472]|uniref:Type IV secretion protein DotI n=1 Tax=Acetobacter estunensis TaxID=104097 RepID=A0A967B9R8_9PROT|nr:DotI/IcmL/TraM family protein [Acetobacter estunensis]NHO54761.1 type IV secretion protein DotI [Acetobacter estunensis]GBQ27951.1 DotI/IcmL protein [Acetobacter estunensis NRIC 0472]
MGRPSDSLTRRLSDPDFQGKVVERSLWLNLVQGGVNVLAIGLLLHAWATRPAPRYFFVDGVGSPRPAIALDTPVLGQRDFLSWVLKWSLAPYNINYRDYATQLNVAGSHYTIEGWQSFAQEFVKQGNLAKLKEAKLLCYAQPTRAPTIKDETIINGQRRYVVQIPFVQTCENVNQENTQTLLATVTVTRVDDPDHPDGLAISQFVARPM